MQLDHFGITDVARFGGFRGDDLHTAVAIALTESGGNIDHQGNGGYGLFGLGTPVASWNDPYVNAMHAHALYVQGGNSFNAWSSFQNGSYRQWLLHAAQAVGVAVGRAVSESEWIGNRPAEMVRERVEMLRERRGF